MQAKIVEALMIEFEPGEPILLDELSFDDVSDDALRQTMKRLVDKGKLERFDRGVYYYTEELVGDDADVGLSSVGQAPTAEEVIRRKYITNGEEVYGFWSGLTLENMMGVSTQVPATLEVISNKEKSNRRKVAVGRQKLYVKKPRVSVTKENYNVMRLLDIVENVPFDQIDSYERKAVFDFVTNKHLKKSQVFEIAANYPSKIMKSLYETGLAYELA